MALEIRYADGRRGEVNDPGDALEVYRHSTSHLMAAAVSSLFPGTHLGIGPAVSDGFFYDCLRYATLVGQNQSYSLNPIVVPPSSNPNVTDPAPNEQDPRTAAPTVRQLYEAQLFQSCMTLRGYKLKQ